MAITAAAPNGIQYANISATTTGVQWDGGKGSFVVHATFGGGTVKLQYLSADATTWVDMGTDTTVTADGGGNFEIGRCQLRVNVATATAVYVVIMPIVGAS